VDRFFRTSLFPLIVIVLLVYLASQTLLGENKDTRTVTYSELVERVRSDPAAASKVVFRPDRHDIRVELVDGDELRAAYPTPRSQVAFENLVTKNGVAYDFDWRDSDESAWWSLVTALLPFALLFGFWLYLTNRLPTRPS
jgi:ATP-dependent Zn protease